MLDLRFCARAPSSCGKWGPLFIAVRGPLTITASLVAEHRLQTRRLSSCGSRAQLLRGTWDPPRPGLEPVSPALADRFSTTAPPGKPKEHFLNDAVISWSLFVVKPLSNEGSHLRVTKGEQIQSLTHQFIHSFNSWIERLLCARYCAECWIEEAMVPAREEFAVWYGRKPQERN